MPRSGRSGATREGGPGGRARSAAVAATMALLLAAAGCTRTGAASPGGPSPVPDRTSPSPVGGPEGSYVYSAFGLTARFLPRAGGGTLSVTNRTGGPIPGPGLYLLDARDGARVEAEARGPASVPDGESRRYEVSLARSLATGDIGLVVLEVEGDDWGAFSPM